MLDEVPAEVLDVSVAELDQQPTLKDPITEIEVKIDPSVPVEVKKDLLKVLNEYNRGALAKNIQELGCITVVQMDIAEMPSSEPVNQKPYRISPSYRATVSTILTKWKNAEIISDSSSPYASRYC